MRTALLCRRLLNALTMPRLIAATALSLYFVVGIMPVPVYAQEQGKNSPTIDARDVPAQTLFNQAVSMEQQESPEKVIARYEEVMQRYGRAATPGSRQFAACALLKKGSILGEQNDTKEAILTYERIERNFGNEKSPAIREMLASALVSKAEAFYKQGDTEKALAAYRELNQQFDKDDNDSIRRLLEITRWRATEIRISNNIRLSSRR